MIKIETANRGETRIISVEGVITGVFANELGRCWRHLRGEGTPSIVLDLDRVTRIDAAGRELLREMYRHGVLFTGARLGIADILHDVRT